MISVQKEKVEVKESKTVDGRRVVSIKRPGSKKIERLDHDKPSCMRSQE